MKGSTDTALLLFVNGAAWMVDFEMILKIIFLLISIGFLLARWWHWHRTKNKTTEKLETI